MGLMCINTSTAPPALCSTPFYNITSQAMPTDVFYSAALPNKVGNRLFSMDAYHGLLLCWDTTLKAACSGSPYQLNTAQPGANLGNTVNQYFGMAPLESRLIAWTDKAFYCFQTFSSPLALCPGFPLTWNQGAIVGTLSAYVAPPIPHVNVTSGAIDGVCFATGNVCIDFAPATRTDWINPWTNSSVLAAIKAAPGIPYFASYVVFKNRVFIYPWVNRLLS